VCTKRGAYAIGKKWIRRLRNIKAGPYNRLVRFFETKDAFNQALVECWIKIGLFQMFFAFETTLFTFVCIYKN
jgi:hypothetical protein